MMNEIVIFIFGAAFWLILAAILFDWIFKMNVFEMLATFLSRFSSSKSKRTKKDDEENT